MLFIFRCVRDARMLQPALRATFMCILLSAYKCDYDEDDDVDDIIHFFWRKPICNLQSESVDVCLCVSAQSKFKMRVSCIMYTLKFIVWWMYGQRLPL